MKNFPFLIIGLLVYLSITISAFGLNLNDPEDCRHVDDACPVWNGWSDPKCHVDDKPVGC
jgi:hypothetical protein